MEQASSLGERNLSDWTAHWSPATSTLPEAAGGFHEAWFLKLNDPGSGIALMLRFSALLSTNGFQRSADTWAVFFGNGAEGGTIKTAARRSHPISDFSFERSGGGIRIGESSFSKERTRGHIVTKSTSIAWDIRIEGDETRFNLVPEALLRMGLIRNQVRTLRENPVLSGTVTVDGRTYTVTGAQGMIGHHQGPTQAHEWVWSHCSTFVNESGEPVDLVFDAISARARIARRFGAPPVSTFLFHYRGERHEFSTLRDLARVRSRADVTEWEFQAERGGLAFRGTIRTGIKDLAGLDFEDTDGSLLHCAISLLADALIHVYRDGNLVETLIGKRSAAFERVSRKPNPYVSSMV